MLRKAQFYIRRIRHPSKAKPGRAAQHAPMLIASVGRKPSEGALGGGKQSAAAPVIASVGIEPSEGTVGGGKWKELARLLASPGPEPGVEAARRVAGSWSWRTSR